MATKPGPKRATKPVRLSPDRNRSKPVSYRFDPEARELLDAIIGVTKEKQVALLERLIRLEARRLKLS